MPKISVIIPTYNCEKHIEEALKSVLEQTYKDYELIIVDDGSTDGTRKIIKKDFNDTRIKYIFQENSGVSVARNKGFLESTGEYIAFLDSDDFWYPEKLEKQLFYLEKNKDIGLVNCVINIVDENSNVIGNEKCKKIKNRIELLFKGNLITGSASAVMIRKSCMVKVGLFDPELSISADLDMWIRVLLHSKGSCISRNLAAIRRLSGSMQSNIKKYEKDMKRVIDKYFSINSNISTKKKNFVYSQNYIMFARSYLKYFSFKNFLRTSFIGIKYYPPNIINLLQPSFKKGTIIKFPQ